MNAGKIYVGTSGWDYAGWKDQFYAGVARKDWLSYNAKCFSGLEVNNSFYRLLNVDATRRWYESTPDNFCFAIKGHKFITHNKRLKEPEASLKLQRENVVGLGNKLRVVLWQLSSNFRKDMARLGAFVKALQIWPEVRHVIEFRHESWFDYDVAQFLCGYRIASSISDAGNWPIWKRVTTDLAYIRLHGRPHTYASAYSSEALNRWAQVARYWSEQGKDVHVYFDNDGKGAAPFDARKFMTLLNLQKEAA
jgi:uncharacterized protein YecE (DUF72 family)